MVGLGLGRVHRNIAANFAGGVVTMGAFVIVVPIYLRLLGAEAYGLVGIFTTLAVAATAFDLGLSHTLNREMARMASEGEPEAGLPDVAVTLQACCWALALAMGMLVVAGAGAIAAHWVNVERLARRDVAVAIVLMGVALPAVVARAFYLAGLNGLQRQPTVNAVQVAATLGRAGLSVAALHLIAPTATVFFTVQAALLYAEATALAVAMWRAVPAGARRGRVRLRVVRARVGFSAGVAVTMILGLVLTAIDQVVLSRILPLAEFGYYMVALGAAGALGHIVLPVTTAMYPRFSELVARSERAALSAEYHFSAQLVAVLVLPLGAVLAVFPGEVLTLWTGNGDVARHGAAVLALRVVGTMLNTMMHVPHVLQLAFGWSSLGAWANAIALLVVAPATVLLALRYGAVGAAAVWIGLNLGSMLFAMRRMHQRVLPGELAEWYRTWAAPALAAAAVALASRAVMPEALDGARGVAWLALTWLATAAAGIATAGRVRRRLRGGRRAGAR
ncbi:MAG TPA: oligosaccharide flippase family protein [Candidatus Limnocylindria bacterium]|nr:oligosaccharide flippase family protein [Candidatus Limnocylindria bacterium]